MTLEEFNAAGQLAKRAADALPSLRELSGYVGIRLNAGRISVEGSGAELQARVDELNQAGAPAVFLLVAPAAAPAAPSAADRVALSTDQLFEAYVREVGPAGLQAVAYTGGHFVVRTGGTNTAESVLPAGLAPQPPSEVPAPGKMSAAEFVARYKNVQLEKGAPIKTEAATTDFFGGQGYVTDVNTICSAGFAAFDAAGLPAVLTAGHCAEDGLSHATDVEPATASVAGGSTTPLTRPLAPLGTFGFSQFGGPGNSWITGSESSPGNIGTDIALIGKIRPDLAIQPAVTKWRGDAPMYTNADPAGPGPTAVKVIGTVAPFQGQAVCLSGRTTGWSCGQVDEVGNYVAAGRTYPRNAGDLRAFRGFLSRTVESNGGDSGGPWISGNFAVGTHSAGEAAGAPEKFAVAATLEDSMAQVPGGVQLKLFLNKPELAGAQTFKAGDTIAGKVPAAPASAVAANSKVRITLAAGPPTEVPVDSAGNWSFKAPATAGPLRFTAETVNGFSASGTASLAVSVSDLDAPVIAAPTEGAALQALSRVDGTGTPGLTVKLTGEITGSAVVAPDGHWTVPVPGPVYGRIAFDAVQTDPSRPDSPSVSRNFTVAPGAPAVTSIVDGQHFSQDTLPASIAGTGLDWAAVTVWIDGTAVGDSPSAGRWSVPFPSGLAAGAHTLSVTQSVEGVSSDPLVVTFSIDAAAAADAPASQPGGPAAAPAGPVGPVTPAAPVGPADSAAPVGSAGSGQLANTGAGSLLPAAGLACGSLLLGAALLILGRRRPVR
jgi:hypothetical protein